jgi:uncharacterized protein (TIGR00369 family)
MTNKRIAELLHMFNEVAPIAQTFGMKLSFDEEGHRTGSGTPQAIVDLPYNPDLDHALGGVHGGVYATMLDTAGWFTAAAAHDVDCWLATSEMSMHLLAPVKETSLRALGRLIKRGRRQDVAEMRLYDGEGLLVGHAIGTFIVLPNVPLETQMPAQSFVHD